MAKYFIQIVAYVDEPNLKAARHAGEVIVEKLQELSIIKPDEDVWVESVEQDIEQTDIGEVKQ